MMNGESDSRATALAEFPALQAAMLEGMAEPVLDAVQSNWRFHANKGQNAPSNEPEWRVWLLMAGRGFGKTRAGAEWVRAIAESDGSARIALVAASLGEARSVMVEGPSGLLAIAPDKQRPYFEPTLRRLTWPTGAQAFVHSAGEPEGLRGAQFSHGWCDEIGKWDHASGRADAAWNNLLLGLRLGDHPQIAATTTPRAVPLVARLVAESDNRNGFVRITRGRTTDNAAHLPTRFIAAVTAQFGGTMLGRQELEGELITDRAGALWSRALLERSRAQAVPHMADLVRIVIGVDPPASAHGDACGIIVCGKDISGTAHVLADASVDQASPERWARAVAEAARIWQADRVIAEANQGGAMVESVLRAAEIALPLRLVHASRGKSARAEPVAALYEAGRVHHAGLLARLEDELCGLMPGGAYEGPGRSPDRADALVWALTELMLTPTRVPRCHI